MDISGKKGMPAKLYQYGALLLLSIWLVAGSLRTQGKKEEIRSFDSYVVSGEEAKELLSGKEEGDLLSKKEAGLVLNGCEVPLDKKKKVFYISQPLAEAEWQGNLTAYGGELCIQEDGYVKKMPEAIAEGHVFDALLCTEDMYQAIGIVITGMPVVSIDTEREEPQEYPVEDIDNYVFNSETRCYGEITIFQSGDTARPEDGSGEGDGYQILRRKVCYHERGQNSALFGKKSYAVKLLDHKEKGVSESLFGMRQSRDWKLLAMYSDPNKVRDKVSMELWEEIAEREESFNERGPEMEYCEVILDGQYMGLYGMMLPVDEDTLELGREDILYKVLDWYMPEEVDIQASVDQNYEVCYPVRIRYPKKDGSVEKLWKPLRDYFSCKYWHLDFNAYSDMTYTENLADYYIFIQTVSGFDNYLKNTYICAKKTGDAEGYRMLTIPWDLNYTFGNCYDYDPEKNYTAFNPDTGVNYVEPVLEQLFRSSLQGEAEILKERWKDYRCDILSEGHITELLQDNMDYLQKTGAFARDTEEWEGALNSSDLTEVKGYVEGRMRYLDEYFGNF